MTLCAFPCFCSVWSSLSLLILFHILAPFFSDSDYTYIGSLVIKALFTLCWPIVSICFNVYIFINIFLSFFLPKFLLTHLIFHFKYCIFVLYVLFFSLFLSSLFSPWIYFLVSFPGGSVVENLPANEGNVGSIPELGSFHGEGNGNSLQYSCLESPPTEDPGSPWGHKRVGHHLVTKQQHIF